MRGSNTREKPPMFVLDQKLLRDIVVTVAPLRVWTRTWVFSIVTTRFVPTAPCVSGGNSVLSSVNPWKSVLVPGEFCCGVGPLGAIGGGWESSGKNVVAFVSTSIGGSC